MKYTVEEIFENFQPWSGAVETFNRIVSEGKADAADRYFDMTAPADGWTASAINDALRFDATAIYRALGMKPDETHEHTAAEIGAAWIDANRHDDLELVRVEIDEAADEVRIIYRDDDGNENEEALTSEDVAELFDDDAGEIVDTETVETWKKAN